MITAHLALVGVVALAGLVFFLALIDVAFHYFSRITIRTQEEEEWKLELLRGYAEDPTNLLVPLRIGIQLSFVGMTVLVTRYYLASELPHPLLLAFLTMIPMFLVFREALPNIIGRRNPEGILLSLLPAFRVYERFVMPMSRPLLRLVRAFTGEEEEEGEEQPVSEEEIQAYIEAGEEEGIFEEDEGRMVQSIVDFGDTIVREVMTPRPEIVAVRHDVTLGELTRLFIEEKHARVPVYRESLDHVVGLIYAIDLLEYKDASPDAPIDPLIREVRFVPETKRVAELLREFQRTRATIAMVVDEYGGTSGLVTVEDLLEEIVGEIHDEFDEVDQEIVREREGVYLVSGRAEIDRVKSELQLEANGEGFETVSGYLLHALGRVPQAGETLELDGKKVEVVDAEGQRINLVRFRLQ